MKKDVQESIGTFFLIIKPMWTNINIFDLSTNKTIFFWF